MPTRAPLGAWIAACAFSLPSIVTAQTPRPDDVVELIVREGPRAVAIRAELEVVKREQEARRPWPNPAVNYSREGAGFTEFLQVEQSMPIVGIRGALTRAGVAALAAAEAERDVRLWQLRADAARATARLTAAHARVEATRAVATRVEGLLAVLRVREQEGEGSRFDRLRAELELADIRRGDGDARATLSTARAELVAMLPAHAALPVPDSAVYMERPIPDAAALTARAAGNRAELVAVRRAMERTSAEALVATRSRWPQPTVTAGLKRADENGTRATGGLFALGVTLPLFDSGRREAARSTAERVRLDAERIAIEQEVRGEVAAAAEVLHIRQEAVRAAPRAESIDDLVTMAELAYREGDLGIVALLDAFRAAGSARVRDVDMRLDARVAQIALERAVGAVLWP
ncbi:MAG: TolC family protein [Vicinamibacteraceae bacterium]